MEYLKCQKLRELLQDQIVSEHNSVKLLCPQKDFDEAMDQAKVECKEAKRNGTKEKAVGLHAS